MICRVWRGWTRREDADAYQAVISTLMWFSSLEAVKAFLPEGHDLAYVPEEALGLLTRFERHAAHYEVLDHRMQPIRR